MKKHLFYILIGAFTLMATPNAAAQNAAAKNTSSTQTNIKLPNNEELVAKAKAGDPDAQAYVGYCYYFGEEGVKVSRQQSYNWLSKSARNKSPYGLFWLAYWYDFYKDDYDAKEKYMKEAFPIFQERAANGDIIAMRYLGRMYFDGIAIYEDEEEARKWLTKAAEKNDVMALLILAANSSRDISYSYYKRAAELGNEDGFYNLALYYIEGRIVEKSYKEAIRYLEMAAEKDYKDAMSKLGELYEAGTGVERNLQEAIKYYKMSADECYGSADRLGCFYRDGVGVDRNYQLAIKYFKKADSLSEYNNNDAELDLKEMQKKGAAYYAKLPLRSPDDLYEIKEDDPFRTLRLSDNWDYIPDDLKMTYLKHFKREKIREWGAKRATEVAQHLVEIGFTEEQLRYSQGFTYEKQHIKTPNGNIMVMKYPHCTYFLLKDKLIAMLWSNGAQVGDVKVIRTYKGDYVVSEE